MHKPAIIVNGRFTQQRLTGVQRYAWEIIHCLNNEVQLLVPPNRTVYRRGPVWEQLILPGLVRSNQLLWSPANTGPLLTRNQVVTIHDISPIDHPEWFTRQFSFWYRALLPHLIRRVRRVVTDSQFSKQRIVERFKVSESKVSVVLPGVSEKFHPIPYQIVSSVVNKYKITRPYILTVGSLEPRKNLNRLFQAWINSMPAISPFNLVVIGSKGYPFRAIDFGELPPEICFLGSVCDEDLPAIYSGATALVYPSIYEGFGLPVLEAMACGTPVAASNAASIPEAVGEAGLLFDPYDIDDITASIQKIIQDEDFRLEQIQLGMNRARQLTWNAASRKILEILRSELLG